MVRSCVWVFSHNKEVCSGVTLCVVFCCVAVLHCVCRCVGVVCYREGVVVDQDQAAAHHQVGQQREGRHVLEVGGEDEEDEGGQEEEHVDARVKAIPRQRRLVGVVHLAVPGGGVGCLHHLSEWRRSRETEDDEGRRRRGEGGRGGL